MCRSIMHNCNILCVACAFLKLFFLLCIGEAANTVFTIYEFLTIAFNLLVLVVSTLAASLDLLLLISGSESRETGSVMKVSRDGTHVII